MEYTLPSLLNRSKSPGGGLPVAITATTAPGKVKWRDSYPPRMPPPDAVPLTPPSHCNPSPPPHRCPPQSPGPILSPPACWSKFTYTALYASIHMHVYGTVNTCICMKVCVCFYCKYTVLYTYVTVLYSAVYMCMCRRKNIVQYTCVSVYVRMFVFVCIQ